MLGDQFRLGVDDVGEFIAKGLSDALVQDLPPWRWITP